MNTRRCFLVAGAIFSAGCSHRVAAPLGYEERVEGLAISPLGDALVVLGSEFHYIFQPPKSLVDALQSELRPRFSAGFDNFFLGSQNKINGEWRLNLKRNSLSGEQQVLAKSLGFNLTHDGEWYQLRGSIAGTRYLRNEVKIQGAEKTNSVYRIRVGISVNLTNYPSPKRSPLSDSDRGLILGFILLFPLIVLLCGRPHARSCF